MKKQGRGSDFGLELGFGRNKNLRGESGRRNEAESQKNFNGVVF